MASTHTAEEAFNYADMMTKEMRLDDVKYEICDEACSLIWQASPWAWTVGMLDTITLVADTVDYAMTFPGDYGDIYKAILTDGVNIFKPLSVEPSLPESPVNRGQTLSVCPLTGTNQVRIYPKPATSLPSRPQYIYLFYKKNPPKITSGNFSTPGAIVLDDRWWHVYKSAVLMLAYKYADDERAFDIAMDTQNKNARLGGELAYFHFLIDDMRKKEPLPYQWETRVEAKATDV